MNNSEYLHLRDLAAELAVEAGVMVRRGRRGGLKAIETKSSATDVVTEFDKASELLITTAIRAQRPDDGFLGEEGTDEPGTSGVMWLIDPIDGTTNFMYDLPGYAVSIAAQLHGQTVAGAVYLPVTEELFVAALGAGATCNGALIAPSPTPILATALISTGFGYSPERRSSNARRVSRLLPDVRDIRRLGAAATDLCYVACGRTDGYFEQWLNPWDIAAGVLICTEAGAKVATYRGEVGERDGLVAANPNIFDALHQAIDG